MISKMDIGAHLDIDTYAGEALVGLCVRLGHVPGPPHHQAHRQSIEKYRNGPSRHWRRESRAQERNQPGAEEASRAEAENLNAGNETDSMEAEKEESVSKATEKVVVKELNINEVGSNAEAGVDYSCNLCDGKFSSLRAVRIHEGKKYKKYPTH